MTNVRNQSFRSVVLLYTLSFLSLCIFLSWPARQLIFGDTSGGAGLGLLIAAPFAFIAGWVFIPVVFMFLRYAMRLPQLPLSQVLSVSRASVIIGIVAFAVPLALPPITHNIQVMKFQVKPTLVSQSVDLSASTYRFTLDLDNKTSNTYENVRIVIAIGFHQQSWRESFIWSANKAPIHTLTLAPGVTTITDSIYLGDCSENAVLKPYPVRLEIALIYAPDGIESKRKSIEKTFILTPNVETVDFATYYTGMCKWFSYE